MTQITEQYWFDMPEFEQLKKEPYTELKIRYASDRDWETRRIHMSL